MTMPSRFFEMMASSAFCTIAARYCWARCDGSICLPDIETRIIATKWQRCGEFLPEKFLVCELDYGPYFARCFYKNNAWLEMPKPVIPHAQWQEFLESFSRRHAGWHVSVETHDLQTAERVQYPFVRLESIELDLEDRKNPRINVLVRDKQKQIKHI